jgi:hypothetical protein
MYEQQAQSRDLESRTVDLTESVEDAAAAQAEHEKAVKDASDAFSEQTKVLKDNISALEDQIGAQRSSVSATYAVEEAVYSWSDAVADTAGVLATATEGSREHREAQLELIEASDDVADAQVRVAEETAAANGATLSATQAEDIRTRSLLQSASTLNGPQRRALLGHIGLLHDIPDNVMTEINAAIDRGDLVEAERLINDTSRTRSAAVRVDLDSGSLSYAERQLEYLARPRSSPLAVTSAMRFRQFASGTPFASSGPALVGEQGPELVDLPMGASVTPARQTAGLAGAAPRSGGNVYVTQNFPAGVRTADVISAQRRYARHQGPL